MATKFLTTVRTKVKTILPRKKKIEDVYEIGDTLGSGNYSVVKIGVHKKTGEQFALKIIEKDKLADFERDNLLTEIDILKNYGNHPNIVSLKEVFEDRKRLILVLELMRGGELLDHIRKHKFFAEKGASKIIHQIIDAVAWLHKNGVIHRDLKPENLLFTSEEEGAVLKLADFGFARYIGDGTLSTPCGSPAYVAPEIVKEEEYNKAVDMWSIGVILYILLCGFPPFYHEEVDKMFQQIREGKYDFPDPWWTKISPSAKELVSSLLKLDPKERITAEDAKRHPWILKHMDTNSKMEDKEHEVKTKLEETKRESLIIEKKRSWRVKSKGNKMLKEEVRESRTKSAKEEVKQKPKTTTTTTQTPTQASSVVSALKKERSDSCSSNSSEDSSESSSREFLTKDSKQVSSLF